MKANTKKLTSTIDYLSDPRKAVTAAVLLVIAVAVVVLLLKQGGKLWNKVVGLWNNSSLGQKTSTKKIENQTGTPSSYLPEQYAQLASRLWDACCAGGDFWVFGTDEDEVYAVLDALQTQADYVMLCNAWVDLVASKSWWVRNLTWAGLQARSTVPGLLSAELTQSELARARSILTSNGITPDF